MGKENDKMMESVRKKAEESGSRRQNLAKAVLINERLRRKGKGEPKAEEIIRRSRDERHG